MPVPHLRRASLASENFPLDNIPPTCHLTQIQADHPWKTPRLAERMRSWSPTREMVRSLPSIQERTDSCYSPLAHHLPTATWRRLEPGRFTDFHPRTPVHAGAHHQVRTSPCWPAAAAYCALRPPRLTQTSYSFMAHPETLLPMSTIDDPVERFVSVVKFYLSGWHIKPPYVTQLVPHGSKH